MTQFPLGVLIEAFDDAAAVSQGHQVNRLSGRGLLQKVVDSPFTHRRRPSSLPDGRDVGREMQVTQSLGYLTPFEYLNYSKEAGPNDLSTNPPNPTYQRGQGLKP